MTNPKTWGEMDDAEKGALLLAYQQGRPIETWHSVQKKWMGPLRDWPTGENVAAYRVRPEPERVTVTQGCVVRNIGLMPSNFPTHQVSFDTLDGEPVCDSIKMERI